MNKEQFEKAMTEIDDSYIEETASYKAGKHKNNFKGFIKRNYGWVIAACFCLCVLGTYALFGESHKSDLSGAADEVTEGSYSDNNSYYESKAADIETIAPGEMEYGSASDEIITEAKNDDKIIYTAQMYGQSTDFEKAAESINSLIKENGAFLEAKNSSEYGYRQVSYVIRVPAENFEAMLSGLENICHVTSSSVNADNISEEYHDMETRLESAKAKLKRLNELLEQAENMEDLITLESAINDAQYEVDYYSGALKNYDSQLSYSTINFELSEVYKITEEASPKSFGERLTESFKDGLQAVGDFFEGFAVWLAFSWFWIVVAGVIVFAIVRIVKHKKKK